MAISLKSVLAPILVGVVGVPILLTLGNWQVDRLEWKHALIDEIETRLEAEPIGLPADPDPVRDRLLRVRVEGRLRETEIHALSSIKRLGPGYRIIVPMDVSIDGKISDRTVMVDLGFVPERLKEQSSRADTVLGQRRSSSDVVSGFVHWPNETDTYTPPPDTVRNIWFARDVGLMAKTLNTDPVLIVAESHPDPDWPLPQPPGSDIRNNHLEYAITWFGLAAVWAVMSVIWLTSEVRKLSKARK